MLKVKGLSVGAFSLLLFATLSSTAAAQRLSLSDLLAAGKDVVIVFHTEDDETRMANSTEGGDNESYADWSFSLNSFMAQQGSRAALYRMTIDEGRGLLGSKGAPKDGWSMVFLKKDKPALYCANPFMSEDQYQIADLYFHDKEKMVDVKGYACSYLQLKDKK